MNVPHSQMSILFAFYHDHPHISHVNRDIDTKAESAHLVKQLCTRHRCNEIPRAVQETP